jgi:hypothetical protein
MPGAPGACIYFGQGERTVGPYYTSKRNRHLVRMQLGTCSSARFACWKKEGKKVKRKGKTRKGEEERNGILTR